MVILVIDGGAPVVDRSADAAEQSLRQVHEVGIGRVGLIKLDGGELGVVEARQAPLRNRRPIS